MNRRTAARTIAALGTAAILAGGTMGTATAADTAGTGTTRNAQTATPAAYITYLSASREEGAAQTLKEFKALPVAKQNKYLDYLNDPKVLKALMEDAPRADRAESRTSMFDGDVVVESRQQATFAPDAPAGSAALGKLSRGTWESWYQASQKILGVTVTKLKVWVNYYTDGNKITRVNFADGAKRNFNAAVSISMGVPKAWKDGSYANGSVVWEGSIIYKGFGIQIDKRQKVWANEYGYRGGYLKNI
ncbi:hypothetical protein [Streptomyces sp. NPDC053048]|uniref:hypothetical protein n=1 Tax=Streptomyces sp. NPDC053048 TaxID=3365694 RepID=UPI0037CE5B03